jgi:hypothetical protein
MPSAPQFNTAEYASAPGSERCASCQQAISNSYYRINSSLACESCAERVKTQQPKDSHAALARGIIFGIGGAIAGLIIYSAFGIITGLEIGYVALAVGWLVGMAIKKGSKGIGGRRYQIAAVALTYLAVSFSAIPIGISAYMKEQKTSQSAAAPSTAGTSGTAQASSSAASTASPAPETTAPALGSVIPKLLFLGVTAPFSELQEGVPGIIGLVILFVGMRIAWKITSSPPLEILSPFPVTAPAVIPGAAGVVIKESV